MTPKIICDTVTMIGFGCELLGMIEISPEQRKNLNQEGESLSNMSLDSARIRGEDLFDEDEIKLDQSNTKLNKVEIETQNTMQRSQ